MKRSEINRSIREALDFLAEHRFPLPEWATWTPPMWNRHGEECREIRDNALGWDVTDFGKGNFSREGLTLFTIRNGNPARDRKTYCEKSCSYAKARLHRFISTGIRWRISSTAAAATSA